MAMIAPMPAVATRRRAIRPDLMMRPICSVNLNYIVQKIPRQRVDRKTRHALSRVGHAVRQTIQSNCPELSGAGPDSRIRYFRPPERSRLSKLAKTWY